MLYQDEESLKPLISRYQQRIFALVLYLIGGDRDKAYDIAASSFVETIRTTPSPWERDIFLARLAGAAIERSRDVKIIPSFDESNFVDLPPGERESLRIVKIALQKVPFNTKSLLLLRNQLHLPYKEISAILRISEKSVRVQTTQARIQLRKKIEEALNGAG